MCGLLAVGSDIQLPLAVALLGTLRRIFGLFTHQAPDLAHKDILGRDGVFRVHFRFLLDDIILLLCFVGVLPPSRVGGGSFLLLFR